MTQVDTGTGMYISNRAVKELPIIDKFLVLTLANLWNFGNTLIQVAVPGLSYVTALREKALKCSVEDRLSVNLQFKKVMKKSLQQNEGLLPLVPHRNKHRNKHL